MYVVEKDFFWVPNMTHSHSRKLQRHMEDQEAGSSSTMKPSFALTLNGVPEDGDEQDVKDVKKKFNRLDHRSIYTIVQMSKDPR